MVDQNYIQGIIASAATRVGNNAELLVEAIYLDLKSRSGIGPILLSMEESNPDGLKDMKNIWKQVVNTMILSSQLNDVPDAALDHRVENGGNIVLSYGADEDRTLADRGLEFLGVGMTNKGSEVHLFKKDDEDGT